MFPKHIYKQKHPEHIGMLACGDVVNEWAERPNNQWERDLSHEASVSKCQGNIAKEMARERPVGEEESGGVHESQVKTVSRMKEGPPV